MNYKVAVRSLKPEEKGQWMKNYLERQELMVKGMLHETEDAIDMSDFSSMPEYEKHFLVETKKELVKLAHLVEARRSIWEEKNGRRN